MTSSRLQPFVDPSHRKSAASLAVLVTMVVLLGAARANAGVTLGFPGVDGAIRDGILHKPPNVHLAVGPGAGASGRVVMTTSAGLQVWDKTGAALDGPLALDAFFGTSVGTIGGTKVLFDEHAGRFFVVGLGGQDANPAVPASAIHVAISTTAAPTNLAADWVRLAGDAATTVADDATYAIGPVGVGADANALYVTTNLVDAGNSFRGAKIRVFDTSATTGLLAGAYTFVDLDIDAVATPNPFYLQPAHVHGTTDSGNFYVVNRVNYGGAEPIGRYRVYEVAGAPAAPTIVADELRGWQVGGIVAGGGPQAGTTTVLDPFPGRLVDAEYRDGALWVVETAQHAATGGGIDVEWVKLATNGGAPAAVTIEDIGAVQGSDGVEWVFNPSIAVGAGGDATICFTQAYYDQFPEMRCARRAASDPAGTFQPSFPIAGSVGFYDSTSYPGLGYEVWGLYSGAVVDPDDDTTVWAANATVAVSGIDSSIWGTYVARLDAVTPAPPVSTVAVEGAGLVRRAVFSPRLGTPAMRGPEAVAIAPDGRHVYVGSAFGTLLGLERRASDGRLQPVEAFSPIAGEDPPETPQQTLYLTFTADGTQAYLADRRGLRVYDRNVGTGLLDAVQVIEETPFGDQIRSMQIALGPDEQNLYVANEAHDSVVTYARNLATGELTYLQEIMNRTSIGAGGVPIRGLRRPAGVVVSPDGTFVYVLSGSSSDDGQAMVVFTRNPVNGTLNHVETVRQGNGIVGLSFPESIAISPDGQNLYVTSHDEDLVSVWTRDAMTGHPTLLEVHGRSTGIANLVGPHGVTVTADGARVYVAGTHASAILVFDRDAGTGALAFVGDVVEGRSGVTGLVNVSRIAASADGRSVYSISPGFQKGSSLFEGKSLDLGAIVHFERDACGDGLVSSLEQCDDGNATSGDGCSDTCRLELCPPLPRPDCRHPVKARGARLLIKRGKTADRDQLQWGWKKGAITTAADYADPLTTASYQLCLYRAAPAPELAATLAAPAGGLCDTVPCWQSRNAGTKLGYDDEVRTPDGITAITLKAGMTDGKSSIALKAAGWLLPLPSMPLALPVTVQLVNGDTGICWEGRYTTASKNDAQQFKATGE